MSSLVIIFGFYCYTACLQILFGLVSSWHSEKRIEVFFQDTQNLDNKIFQAWPFSINALLIDINCCKTSKRGINSSARPCKQVLREHYDNKFCGCIMSHEMTIGVTHRDYAIGSDNKVLSKSISNKFMIICVLLTPVVFVN